MTVPYIFTPGTVISSAQVNANFAAVRGTGDVLGVTDGSTAAPGYVGEVWETDNGANWVNAIATSPGTAILTTNLPAGDWDIQSFVQMQGTSGASVSSFSAWCGEGTPVAPGTGFTEYTNLGFSSSVLSGASLTLPTRYISSSAVQPITMWVTIAPSGGQAWGSIRARRMR